MFIINILKGIEDMLALCETRVNIGVAPLAGPAVRHGVLWTVVTHPDGTKESVRVPFVLDKPERVRNGLNYATWNRLNKQITKMSIVATHLELECNDHHYCYTLDKYKELYATEKQGQPRYQLGFS